MESFCISCAAFSRAASQDASGSQIATRRSAVCSGDRIGRLESENAYLREQLAKSEEILKNPAKLRSKANTIEFKAKVNASQVKGNSWSGKIPLTGDQLEELYQIGRTGAMSFSFEDHSLVDYIALHNMVPVRYR